MQHPDITMMIADSIMRERLQRAAAPQLETETLVASVRTFTGNVLIAIGTKIAPAPHQAASTQGVLHIPISLSPGK